MASSVGLRPIATSQLVSPAAQSRVSATQEAYTDVDNLYASLALPLQSKCIRVIDVKAASSTADDALIIGCLRVVDLEDTPHFAALPYVWGTERERYTISCNGIDLAVSKNCFSALRHLRKKLGSFSVWIDAVCINQKGNSEKKQQIPLMGDIYSGAKETYLWLGEGTAQSDKAMVYLGRTGLLKYFSPAENSSHHLWAAVWSLHTSLRCGKQDLFLCTGKVFAPLLLSKTSFVIVINSVLRAIDRWTSSKIPFARRIRHKIIRKSCTTGDDLSNLLDRSWIARIWTFQELLLSSNPIVVCGDHHLVWSKLVWGLLFVQASGLEDEYSEKLSSILLVWLRLAFTRTRLSTSQTFGLVQSHAELLDSPTVEAMQRYQSFVWDIISRNNKLRNLGLATFCALIILLPIAALVMGRSSVENSLGGFLVGFVMTLNSIVLLPLLFIWSFFSPSFLKQRRRRRDYLAEDLSYGILSRKATDPKDMAFGVYGVLQKFDGIEMLPPDYSRTVGEIYLSFCVRLLPMHRFSLLRIAAMKTMPGQPSWVPDWSNEFPPEIRRYDTPTYQTPDLSKKLDHATQLLLNLPGFGSTSSRHHDMIQEVDNRQAYTQTNPWIWDPSVSHILKVRGIHLGTITSVHRFQEAKEIFSEDQRPIHLGNLESMVAFVKEFDNIHMVKAFGDLFHGASISESRNEIQTWTLRNWVKFTLQRRHESPHLMLQELQNTRWDFVRFLLWDHVSPFGTCFGRKREGDTRRSTILRAQLLLSHYLAKTNQQLFWCKLEPGRIGPGMMLTTIFGFCTGDLECGDTLTWLDESFAPGSQEFLVNRMSNRCFITRSNILGLRLVGPAVVGHPVLMGASHHDDNIVEDVLEYFDLC
jgi:hypothetical protein